MWTKLDQLPVAVLTFRKPGDACPYEIPVYEGSGRELTAAQQRTVAHVVKSRGEIDHGQYAVVYATAEGFTYLETEYDWSGTRQPSISERMKSMSNEEVIAEWRRHNGGL